MGPESFSQGACHHHTHTTLTLTATRDTRSPTMAVSHPPIDLASYLIDPPRHAEPSRSRGADLFGNDQPTELEIGAGKGLFLADAASSAPTTTFWE